MLSSIIGKTIVKVGKADDDSELLFYFDDGTGFPFYHLEEETKWYDCEEDMTKISKEYPDIMFEVERIGEDPDDRVIMRFKNGDSESVTGEFVYADFKRLTCS